MNTQLLHLMAQEQAADRLRAAARDRLAHEARDGEATSRRRRPIARLTARLIAARA